MNIEDQELLQKVLEFLNQVPNRKYGDNYTLSFQFSQYIKKNTHDWEEEFYKLHAKYTGVIWDAHDLLLETRRVLKGLKKDAKMALKGEWAVDYTNSESMEGFTCQINDINKILNKIKQTQL